MSNPDSGTWRDETRLPLRELERALSAAAQDGQVDDVTGNEAGQESAFGHGPEPADRQPPGSDPTDPDRAHRPSTTGRTGPH